MVAPYPDWLWDSDSLSERLRWLEQGCEKFREKPHPEFSLDDFETWLNETLTHEDLRRNLALAVFCLRWEGIELARKLLIPPS